MSVLLEPSLRLSDKALDTIVRTEPVRTSMMDSVKGAAILGGAKAKGQQQQQQQQQQQPPRQIKTATGFDPDDEPFCACLGGGGGGGGGGKDTTVAADAEKDSGRSRGGVFSCFGR